MLVEKTKNYFLGKLFMTPDNTKQESRTFFKEKQAVNTNQGIEKDRQLLLDAKKKGGLSICRDQAGCKAASLSAEARWHRVFISGY